MSTPPKAITTTGRKFTKRKLKSTKFEGVKCSNEHCDRQAVIESAGVPLCNRHYLQWRVHGDWNLPDKTAVPGGICSVDGCDNPVRSKFSDLCEAHYFRKRRGSKNWDAPIKPPCKQCGAELTGNQSQFCSPKCMRDYSYAQIDKRMRRWNTAHKMRAKAAGCEYEDVDILAIFEEADWTCYLCGEKIDPEIRWPDRECASLDHEIAIKSGGGHTKDNCKPTHARCNFKKAHEHDTPNAAKVRRMAGETGQYARRKKNGPKLKKPEGYKYKWPKRKIGA